MLNYNINEIKGCHTVQTEMESGSSKATSKSCGYQYMTPSYVLDEELDEAASYSVVANALLENSSAHGLPTLYRAQGNTPWHIQLFSDLFDEV